MAVDVYDGEPWADITRHHMQVMLHARRRSLGSHF